MTFEEFKNIITENFNHVDDDFFDNLIIYKKFLQEYNSRTNLTRLDTEDKIWGEYFYESIIPYKEIDFSKTFSLLDIGSGSGVPGVVLKLLNKNIELVIIESNNKKIEFLRLLALKLNIQIELKTQRAEEITENDFNRFDYVTSRAVAELRILIEISVPYCKIGGTIIEPKSSKVQEEIENSKWILNKYNIQINNISKFISQTSHEHNVLFLNKKNQIPNGFPRKWKDILS